jgi:hypothetical protein
LNFTVKDILKMEIALFPGCTAVADAEPLGAGRDGQELLQGQLPCRQLTKKLREWGSHPPG